MLAVVRSRIEWVKLFLLTLLDCLSIRWLIPTQLKWLMMLGHLSRHTGLRIGANTEADGVKKAFVESMAGNLLVPMLHWSPFIIKIVFLFFLLNFTHNNELAIASVSSLQNIWVNWNSVNLLWLRGGINHLLWWCVLDMQFKGPPLMQCRWWETEDCPSVMGRLSRSMDEDVTELQSSSNDRHLSPRSTKDRFCRFFLPAALRLYNQNGSQQNNVCNPAVIWTAYLTNWHFCCCDLHIVFFTVYSLNSWK